MSVGLLKPDGRVCALFEVQEGKCFHCDKPMMLLAQGGTPKTVFATKEHVHPRGNGGWGMANNIVLAHYACNHKRGDKKPTDEEIERTKEIYAKFGMVAFDSKSDRDVSREKAFGAAKRRFDRREGIFADIPISIIETQPEEAAKYSPPKLGDIIPRTDMGETGRNKFIQDWKTKWEPVTEWLKEKK
jgi:hypothetical protein